MSQKKHTQGGSQKGAPATQKKKAPEAQKKNSPELPKSKLGIIIAVVALVGVGALAAINLGGGGTGSPGAAAGNGAAPQVTAEEAQYIGRLLPAGYQAPSVAAPTAYTSTVEMTELTPTVTDTQLTIAVADVTTARIALLQYAGTAELPIIAYVKPSGTLFIGVSFCPPCQGEWQTIQADGTLTCNSCGTKRDLESMVGISGACKLYPLDEIPVSIVDGNIVIERGALDSWTAQPLDRKVG